MTITAHKNYWRGEHVAKELNVSIDNLIGQKLNIEDTVGLALRNNPKRAHLLVSKILGKHIPASPSLITASGQLLGAMAYEALGGRLWAVDGVFDSIHESLNGSTDSTMVMGPPSKVVPAVTIGYAETATSLGYIVANFLSSPYIHSTRYGREDIKPYGAFEEAHSHATSHKLMPTKHSFLKNSLPLVLVDDEMSTGKTIIATIAELHALSPRDHYVVCSLIDCRTEADKERMRQFAASLNIKLDVVALAHGEVSYPDTILEDVKPVIASIEASVPEISITDKKTLKKDPLDIDIKLNIPFEGFKHARYGITDVNRDHKIASDLARMFDSDPEKSVQDLGKILVLGTEEFMYLPLRLAKMLEEDGFDAFSSSTTRSPVIPYDSEEYAIRTKLTYYLPDGDERYLYNAHNFDTIIIVVEPGNSYLDFFVNNGLIQKLETTSATKIILIQGDTNVR
jgi:hypothetical protein